jgi:SulP family sulfate permease
VKSGGRGRLSTLVAGVFLLVLVVGLGDTVGRVPMPALVAVMIMVSIGTFSWASLANLRTHPRTSSVVMLSTVAVVVATHNLAIGVMVGVLLSGIFFAWKIGQIFGVTTSMSDDGRRRIYIVSGQVFFASAEQFINSFDFEEALDEVVIDVRGAHFWDISAVAALDKVILKFRRDATDVEILGMNAASSTIVDKLAVHDKADAFDLAPGH